MGKIFLSYRRSDSAAMCDRIYHRLAQDFGDDAIFKDIDSIPMTEDFGAYIRGIIPECSVLLAIIGKTWLEVVGADGRRRLDDPRDPVRIEIEAALAQAVPVAPLMVDGAHIPPADRLPTSMRGLVNQNGREVHYDPYFETDMRHVVTQLEQWVSRRSSLPSPPPPTPNPNPTDPYAALVTRLLPGIRDAYTQQNWDVVLEKADLLTSEVPAGSVPTEVWRMLGQARSATGDATAAITYLKRALALADAPAERLPLLHDYAAALSALKQWDELLRRAEEGSRLAPDDVFWPRTRLHALTELHRDADALDVLRTLTARPDTTAADWLVRARLARAVAGKTEAANTEARSALDAAARLASPSGPDAATVAAARRELFWPIASEHYRERLASLGFVAHEGKDPQTGKEVSFIVPPTVPVPAGSFQMGKANRRDPHYDQYDGPARTASTTAFAIARYPVTVAEYACFVRAGQKEPEPVRSHSVRTVHWRDQLGSPDHPVTCVTWHEAVAYTEWLAGLTSQAWRLPTEEEWEKAARWDPRSGKSFVYPWGDTFDYDRCNTAERDIGRTTSVGYYVASGASPSGAEDMAGNVWEWTNSLYDNSTRNHVLRGGSWAGGHGLARAARRLTIHPDDFNGGLPGFNGASIGFRVILATLGS